MHVAITGGTTGIGAKVVSKLKNQGHQVTVFDFIEITQSVDEFVHLDLSNNTSIEEALKEADFIQECASENYKIKTKLMNVIGNYAKPNAIISSSSSGLLPTRIYSKCKNPERGLIGHPFNPVYLLPAVEIVPGKKTSKKNLNIAKAFYKSISMNPIMVKSELPGYLSDRLQEALWREGLHIINEGYATTEELDRAIEDGPGLRWSLMGTFLTFHLAGGKS